MLNGSERGEETKRFGEEVHLTEFKDRGLVDVKIANESRVPVRKTKGERGN